jgi:hypothetical protein
MLQDFQTYGRGMLRGLEMMFAVTSSAALQIDKYQISSRVIAVRLPRVITAEYFFISRITTEKFYELPCETQLIWEVRLELLSLSLGP